MHFGALMLRAGNAAFRVRQWMNELARAMGIDALAVHIAIGGGMTATARRGGEHVTLASEIAPLGINASRLGLLERLAREARPGLTTAELAAKLKAIEAEPPFYSLAVTAAAVGAASGAFSFLNSGGPSEIVSAFIGGAVGQSLRSLLFRYRHQPIRRHRAVRRDCVRSLLSWSRMRWRARACRCHRTPPGSSHPRCSWCRAFR